MKTNSLIAALLFLCLHASSQQLSQVTFAGGSNFSWFTFSTYPNILIRISGDGNILEYGTEEQSLYNRNYFAAKLRPFEGRIEYYSNSVDSAFRGKIKSIGTCYFTYYASTDYPEQVGKIRSAGSLLFDYYRKFDNDLITGKIKNIGTDLITYYSASDDEAFRGKPRSIGMTSIVYFSSYEDRALRGKVKSVGSFQFSWYTSYDRSPGVLKSGIYRQMVNGVTYIMQQ